MADQVISPASNTTDPAMATIDAKENAKETGNQQLIVFRLGGEEYGVSIKQVKEIVIMPPVARIPLTPPYVKGVANVRGNILAIIDLAEKFGFAADAEPTADSKPSYILVMESENLKMGIMVKEVPSTLSVNSDQIDYSPSIIHDSSIESNYIKGIVRAGSRLIILIDMYKVVSKEALQSVVPNKI
ncbi:MAG: chemotaxis protein CheW [Bacteroidota bacterium]